LERQSGNAGCANHHPGVQFEESAQRMRSRSELPKTRLHESTLPAALLLTFRSETTENRTMAVYLDHAGRPLPQKLAKSDGIRFHYIRGGKGPTVVLIAGFPQSVYAWRRVIPLLTDAYDVIALDLPGQGDSDKPLDGYDTATAAKRINGFLKTIGVGRHYFVGHDIGSWIGYPYAHEFASELNGVVYLDANIPGVTLKPSIDVADPDWKSWHFLFNMVDDLPEALLWDRERILIEWFFNKKTANAIATFSKDDIDEYVRVYRWITSRCSTVTIPTMDRSSSLRARYSARAFVGWPARNAGLLSRRHPRHGLQSRLVSKENSCACAGVGRRCR
jgi:pimeloyl-ACP methyl ester carboxylesterase